MKLFAGFMLLLAVSCFFSFAVLFPQQEIETATHQLNRLPRPVVILMSFNDGAYDKNTTLMVQYFDSAGQQSIELNHTEDLFLLTKTYHVNDTLK